MRSLPCVLAGLLLAPAAATAQTVTANETTVRAGASMSASWTAPAGHSSVDWISVYSPMDASTQFGQWASPSFVYTGAPLSGMVGFDVYRSTPPGTYEYRYLLNNGYVVAATSAPVTVIGPCDGTTIDVQVTPSVMLAGEDVDVTWTLTGGDPEVCAQASDWVAMWAAGAPDVTSGYGGTAPTFVYTADQVTGSETFTVNASTTPGDYEFRYIPQSGTSSIGISAPITVLEPCATTTYELTATPGVVTPEESVTVEWTVTTPNPGGCLSGSDWIAFFAEGAPNTAYGGTNPSFVYTGGLAAGEAEFTLTGPPLGLYEFRYLRSGSVPAAASELVQVVEPASVPTLGPWAFGALALALAAAARWRRRPR